MVDQQQAQSEQPVAVTGGTAAKATPLQMVSAVVFLVVCIAICGGFFGWFGKGKTSQHLGVSREAVTEPFSKVGFAFRPGADMRGLPVEEATSPDGISVVRIVGPRENLAYASVATNLERQMSGDQQTLHSMYVVALVHTVVPQWEGKDIVAWLNESAASVKPGASQVEKKFGDIAVKLIITPTPVTMTVSVESKGW